MGNFPDWNYQKAPAGVESSSENLAMKWSNHLLREVHRFQTATQPLEKQWKVLVLGLLTQQSSLEQLKYLPDANATLSRFCATCNKPVCSVGLHSHKQFVCDDCVSDVTLTGKCHVCAFYK